MMSHVASFFAGILVMLIAYTVVDGRDERNYERD
jgi:hypothetical protein